MCLWVQSCSGHSAALGSAGAGRALGAGSRRSCCTVLPAAGVAPSQAAACGAMQLALSTQ